MPGAPAARSYLTYTDSYSGGTRAITANEGSASVERSDNFGAVTLRFNGAGGSESISFGPPKGRLLTAGTYAGAMTNNYDSGSRPVFSFWGGSCSQTTAQSTIKQIKFTEFGTLLALEATFEQSCSNGRSVFGRARYDAADR